MVLTQASAGLAGPVTGPFSQEPPTGPLPVLRRQGGRHAAPAPPEGVRPPEAIRPPQRRPALTGLVLAGAHGGAGTSTLAALLRAEFAGKAEETGRDEFPLCTLPAFPDGDPGRIASRTSLPGRIEGPFIVIARGNPDGMRRAVVAVTALEYIGIAPAALAVVGDGAGPFPRAAAQRLALLDGRAGAVVTVPYAAALRTAASPAQARLPRGLRRAVAELAGLDAMTRLAGARSAGDQL